MLGKSHIETNDSTRTAFWRSLTRNSNSPGTFWTHLVSVSRKIYGSNYEQLDCHEILFEILRNCNSLPWVYWRNFHNMITFHYCWPWNLTFILMYHQKLRFSISFGIFKTWDPVLGFVARQINCLVVIKTFSKKKFKKIRLPEIAYGAWAVAAPDW